MLRQRDPHSPSFLYMGTLPPFNRLGLKSGNFKYQLFFTLLPDFPPSRFCNHNGLLGAQEVNRLNILVSDFFTCSKLLAFTASSCIHSSCEPLLSSFSLDPVVHRLNYSFFHVHNFFHLLSSCQVCLDLTQLAG